MKRIFLVFMVMAFVAIQGRSQTMTIGGRIGLSRLSVENVASAGLQLGITGDYAFKHNMIVGTELNLNTQSTTPLEWGNYFKYLIDMPEGKQKPYIDGGFSIWAFSGGPYFGFRFGGGVYFPLTSQLSIPADLQFGPIFASGSTVFYFALTTGIRYTLPN
jgi:hypothetical protein